MLSAQGQKKKKRKPINENIVTHLLYDDTLVVVLHIKILNLVIQVLVLTAG